MVPDHEGACQHCNGPSNAIKQEISSVADSFSKRVPFLEASKLNPLTPNDVYISRTEQLTSRRRILNIYSTNIPTEYFKHAANSTFFFLSSRCCLFNNAIFFGSRNIHILKI